MNLADRLRDVLARPAPAERLAGDDYVYSGDHVPAAVLIGVTDRPDPGVLLTLRQATLRRHAGQISFPGGRVDPSDSDSVAAALREANEEIGLDPAAVDIVGTDDIYRTGSGYAIVPVVGVIPPDLPLTPYQGEVAALFEVPLAFLTEQRNHVVATQEFGGRQRTFTEIQWQDRRIWGITAGLIVNLSRRLAASL